MQDMFLVREEISYFTFTHMKKMRNNMAKRKTPSQAKLDFHAAALSNTTS
jgi:hypothetical protein